MLAPACSTQIHAEDASILDGIVSDDAYVIDTDNDQVLASKNADTRMYPASMTKIMTGILAIEKLTDLDQKITITNEMIDGLAEAEASVAGFQIGDTPTVRDLLYGCALPSGADAANALAIASYGSLTNFVQAMNQKAAELGLTNTHFMNPTGLHDDDHYSTTKEIAQLLRYCLKNETFTQVYSAASYTTTSLSSAPAGIVLNSSSKNIANLTYQIPEMIGAKSGYTPEAGHCLASWDTVNNMHLIIVTAHADTGMYSSQHIVDLATIMTHLRNYYPETIVSTSDSLKDITLNYLFHTSIQQINPDDDVIVDAASDDAVTYETDLPDEIAVANTEQIVPYTITIKINGTMIKEIHSSFKVSPDTNFFTRILRSMINLFQ